ncbi:hypothetical protein MK137Hg34_000304500, partial [Viscerimonas tarda]
MQKSYQQSLFLNPWTVSNGIGKAVYTGMDDMYGGYELEGIGFSWDNLTLHTINYYDNYNFLPATTHPQAYDARAGYGARHGTNADQVAARGLLTKTTTYVLGSPGGVFTTVFYYDYKGQLVQSKSTNLLGGVEREYLAYNFTGQVTRKLHEHTPSATGTLVSELYTYTYDHAGRMTQTRHKLNNQTEIILAQNTYDELGRLKTTAPKNNTTMKLTYTYNTRSWLTNISGTRLSENIYYNQSAFGGTPRYNGNISTVLFDNYLGYNYTYDNLNRLTQAQSIMTGDWGTSYGAYDTQYTYDKNGNMTSLFRLSD